MASLSLCFSCGPQAQLHGSIGTGQDSGEVCRPLRPNTPSFATPPPAHIPGSVIVLHAQLGEEWLNRQLSKHAPLTLAQENDREVGTPGRATYTVTRGAVTLNETPRGPSLKIPVRADISVCKPFGSSCFRYGSCSPEFAIQVEVAPTLDENYNLSSPRFRSATKVGCRIAIDVTPQLESIVHKELASVERRVDRQWPNVGNYARVWAEHQAQPITLWPDSCVTWKSPSFKQLPLHLVKVSNGMKRALALGASLEGKIRPETNCNTQSQNTRTDPAEALPALKTVKNIATKTSIYLPEHLTTTALSRAIIASMGVEKSFSIDAVQLSKDRIFLKLALHGRYCGEMWVSATPKLDSTGQFLVLSQLSPFEKITTKKLREQLADIRHVIETKVRIKLAGAAWLAAGAHVQTLFQLLDPIKDELGKHAIELAVSEITQLPAKVSLADDGVYVFYPLTAELSLDTP